MNGIFWIEGEPSFPLATVLCPLGGDGLEKELLEIKSNGIETVVSLLEHREAEMLGLGGEGRLAAEIGWISSLIRFPMGTFRRTLRTLRSSLQASLIACAPGRKLVFTAGEALAARR